VQAIGAGVTLACDQGVIRFQPTAAFQALAGEGVAALPVRQAAIQGSNTAVVLGEKLFLKGYRHLQFGTNPELEIGRFLTEVVKFANLAPVAGAVEYQAADGGRMTLALLQAHMENQGDCWRYTLNYLERFLSESRAANAPPEPVAQAHHAYLLLIRTLGQRTGELHNALSNVTGDPAFDPEPVSSADLVDWVARVQAEAETSLNQLEQRLAGLDAACLDAAKNILAQRSELSERLRSCVSGREQAVKIRCHGDYHLGQVLLAKNDFVLIDFEGEPSRTLLERRHKHSPLCDVAGMLLSFNYAAQTAMMHAAMDKSEDINRIAPLLIEWESELGRVFLAAYDDAVHGSGLIAPDASLRGLLDLFLLEKALYELRYELDNRPDWVGIPLRGILSLLQLKKTGADEGMSTGEENG